MKKAPTHLQKNTRIWWQQVVADYELESHHIKLLTLAAEAWDRCQQARTILDEKGLVFYDRFGSPKARPEVAVERDSRIAFARLLRELALDLEPPEDSNRPPRLC